MGATEIELRSLDPETSTGLPWRPATREITGRMEMLNQADLKQVNIAAVDS
jgi:hypothetical protein